MVESRRYSPFPNLPPAENEDIRFMVDFLKGKQLPGNRQPWFFSNMGMFEVENIGQREGFTELWSLGLLSLSPEQHRLMVNNNSLIEVKALRRPFRDSPTEFFISPASTFFAMRGDIKNGELVDESRFVISDSNLFKSLQEFKASNPEIKESPQAILTNSLRKVVLGERPDFITPAPFARVPKEFVGHRLTTIIIARFPIRGPGNPALQDVLVINPENRTLVPRMVDHPLHPDRWQD